MTVNLITTVPEKWDRRWFILLHE